MTFERRDLGGGAYALVVPELERAGFLAAFTERTGGVSRAPRFSSLNLSFSSGDEPAFVADNRRRVIDLLKTGPIALGGQVHGTAVAALGAGERGRGADGPAGVIPATDGLYTREADVALAVAIADCAPVVLADDGGIAVVHAGWRGVAGGVLDTALAHFPEPARVAAVVGPCAGGCCYEVGEDVVAAVDRGAGGAAVWEMRADRPHLDLGGTIGARLRALGVGRVEVAGLCTIHEEERFFSHRRQGPCGRQMAIVVKR